MRRNGAEEQDQIAAYIARLPLYEGTAVNGTSCILLHEGLPDFSDMPLEYYDDKDLVFDLAIFSSTSMMRGQTMHVGSKMAIKYRKIPLKAW